MGPLAADRVRDDILADDRLGSDVRVRLERELEPGERLLWAGRPSRRAVDDRPWLSWWVWWAGDCSILAAGCGLLLCAGGDPRLASVASGLTWIGVAAVACCTIAGIERAREQGAEGRRRSGMSYALTDRRAICWIPAARRALKVVTIPGRSIGFVHRVELGDGSGSVRFAGEGLPAQFSGFEGVADVRHVEHLARGVLVDPDYREPDAGDEFD